MSNDNELFRDLISMNKLKDKGYSKREIISKAKEDFKEITGRTFKSGRK